MMRALGIGAVLSFGLSVVWALDSCVERGVEIARLEARAESAEHRIDMLEKRMDRRAVAADAGAP